MNTAKVNELELEKEWQYKLIKVGKFKVNRDALIVYVELQAHIRECSVPRCVFSIYYPSLDFINQNKLLHYQS